MTSPDPRAALADELLPCPFCGPEGNPNLHECDVGPLNGGRHVWFCKCTTCDIELDFSDTAQAAVVRWNTRSPFPYSGAAREQVAQQILAAIRKVRDGYADQANFADIDAAVYFREFVRRLDLAVAGKSGNEVPPWGGTSSLSSPATTLPRDAERETIERLAKSARSFAASAREGASKAGALDSRAASETYQCLADQFDSWASQAQEILALPSIPSREGMEREGLEALAVSLVSIIQDGRAQEAGSKSIASIIINELLARRVIALSPSLTSVMPDEGKQK